MTFSPYTAEWTDADIAMLNRVAAYLALDTFSPTPAYGADTLVVLAGNAVLATADGAFALARARHLPLLISGGIGHATPYLMDAIAAHPAYRAVAGRDRAEADALGRIASDFWQIPQDRILIENTSTNCGENADFSLRRLAESGLAPRRIVLIQDPLMQRRSDASFRRAGRGRDIDIVNWPVLSPRLMRSATGPAYTEGSAPWPIERFVSLILGEIPRLRDDATGYGPRGRGFIAHVDIPPAVEEAHAFLMHRFGESGLTDRVRPPR